MGVEITCHTSEKIERNVTVIFMTEILGSYDFRHGKDQRAFVSVLMLQHRKQNRGRASWPGAELAVESGL